MSPDFDEIATFLRLRLRRRAMILFLTSLDDPVLAENFARATQFLARRHLVMAGMPRPESAQPLFHDSQVESTEDIYRHLAGHLIVEARLSRSGIDARTARRPSGAVRFRKIFAASLIGLYGMK